MRVSSKKLTAQYDLRRGLKTQALIMPLTESLRWGVFASRVIANEPGAFLNKSLAFCVLYSGGRSNVPSQAPRFMMVCLLHAAFLPQAARCDSESASLSAQEIMARVAENQDRAQQLREEYIYRQHIRISTRRTN